MRLLVSASYYTMILLIKLRILNQIDKCIVLAFKPYIYLLEIKKESEPKPDNKQNTDIIDR